jgi:hypothetical protein
MMTINYVFSVEFKGFRKIYLWENYSNNNTLPPSGSAIDLILSDVKDALDNMNALNQHSVHRHLFRL